MNKFLFALLFLFAPLIAKAQSANSFPTTNQDQRVPGALAMCLNTSGQAVPCSANTPLVVSGGSGSSSSNQGSPNAGGTAAWFVQWAGQSVAVTGSGVPIGPNTRANARPVTQATDDPSWRVADPNNAAYSTAGSTFATGATVTAGRAIYLNCSASGSVTMSLSGGGSLAYPVTTGANVLPFAVTSVSADTASCTHQNVN